MYIHRLTFMHYIFFIYELYDVCFFFFANVMGST